MVTMVTVCVGVTWNVLEFAAIRCFCPMAVGESSKIKLKRNEREGKALGEFGQNQ